MCQLIDAAIEQLYRTHGHSVYRRCCVLLGNEDEAYDALQEVFVKVLSAKPNLDGDKPIQHWLNRVTTNHCFNRLRARRYRRHFSLHEVEGVADTTQLQFMTHLAEQRDLVRWLLMSADARTLQVVVAYFYDETPVISIGEELGISVPTVRRVLKKFLRNSRSQLERAERRMRTKDGSEAGV